MPQAENETKGLLSSKSMWFNLLVTAGALYLQRKGVSLSTEEIATVYGAGNIVLRAITGQPIDIRKVL